MAMGQQVLASEGQCNMQEVEAVWWHKVREKDTSLGTQRADIAESP